MTNKPTDAEIIKAFDILDKFEFFGGRRAGRELWFNKPTDIQNKDIGEFLRNLDFLRLFINRLKAENEELNNIIFTDRSEAIKLLKAEAIKEVVGRLQKSIISQLGVSTLEKKEAFCFCLDEIDEIESEMVGEDE